MRDKQFKTLSVRTGVKLHIAIEGLLTEIAKEELFADVPTDELIATIIQELAIDDDTRADMLAYLDSERNKEQ